MTKQPASCSARKVLRLSAIDGWESLIGHLTLKVTSMVVARHEILRDALKFHRRLEHHAIAELIDHGALDFLPRRLAWRIAIAAALLQRRTAFGQLCRRNHHIGGAIVEIDTYPVAGLEQRETAAGGCLGRRVKDR